MNVESTALARARAFELSPRRFVVLAVTALGALWLIVATGAAVRLTASGLGCESWPGCTQGNPFPAEDSHAFIEFGNRLLGGATIALTALLALAARRTPGLPRWAVWLALGTCLGTVAQAPLGALTVATHLHPLLVMAHLLLSMVVLGAAVVLTLEALALGRGHASPFSHELRGFGIALAAGCFGLVLSGTFVTAAGPHSGGEEVARFGNFDVSLFGHAASVAVFAAGLVFVVGYLAARRREWPRLFRVAIVLAALLLVQMGIGELQYRTELPWGLVLLHVALAATVWVAVVAFVAQLWRPLAGLDRPT